MQFKHPKHVLQKPCVQNFWISTYLDTSHKLKFDGSAGLPIVILLYEFLLAFNSSMWPNFARYGYFKFQWLCFKLSVLLEI